MVTINRKVFEGTTARTTSGKAITPLGKKRDEELKQIKTTTTQGAQPGMKKQSDSLGPPTKTPLGDVVTAQLPDPSQDIVGLKNILPTIGASLPGGNKVVANVNSPLLKKTLELGANNPLLLSLGIAGLYTGITAVTGTTAVTTAARVGTSTVAIDGSTGTAGTFATNSLTQAATTSWLSKLTAGLTNPAVLASSLVAIIGSYPFAGFIKEEALQTTSFAFKTAEYNNDLEGMEAALDFTRELLDEGVWEKILNAVPFGNVLTQLKNFYQAARLKVQIDEKVFQDAKKSIEEGESKDDKTERIKQEESDSYKASIDYYNSERQKLLSWEMDARNNQLDKEARFWAKERQKQSEEEAKDREAIADFWFQYRKEIQKANEATRPSNLNFGLL